jgi:hypothetical protein
MNATVIATASVFTTGHIVFTGLLSGLIAAIVAVLLLRGKGRTLDALAIGLLTAGAVFLLRKSANMPQLNNDGLSPLSANDLLAPALTFVTLGLYAPFRQPNEPRRFEQARAAATLIAFAVNVITI